MPNNLTITIGQLRTLMYETEDSDNPKYLNTFSNAGKGKSGHSWGVMQFDVNTNPAAGKFLKDNGFSQKQIDMLKSSDKLSDKDEETLDKQLQAIPQNKMDAFTTSQLQILMTAVDRLIDEVRIYNPYAAQTITGSQELQLRIADYFNQYGSHNSDFVRYLEGHPVHLAGDMMTLPKDVVGSMYLAVDIQDFIDNSAYNQEYVRRKKNPGHKSRPDVISRAQRLEIALRQLGLSSLHPDWRALRFNSGGYYRKQFDSSNGISPPVWSTPDDLGISPPSVGADDTHEGLF
jgi:hypothetical protein